MVKVIFVLAYLIFAPFVGALLDGVDRIISARMQRERDRSFCSRFMIWVNCFPKKGSALIMCSCSST